MRVDNSEPKIININQVGDQSNLKLNEANSEEKENLGSNQNLGCC